MCECTYDTLCHECECDQNEMFSLTILGLDCDENLDYDE